MPKLTRTYLLSLLILLTSCSVKQSFDYDSLLVSARKDLRRGEYDEALKAFIQLKASNEYYDRAMKGIIDVYQEQKRSKDLLIILEQEVSTKSTKYLLSAIAGIYRQLGLFDESLDYYGQYLDLLPEGHKNVSRVNNIIAELEYALSMLNNPYQVEILPLSPPINSEWSEYSPSFTLDGMNITFTREIGGQEDLYEAQKNGPDYIVRPINAINTRYNEGAQSIAGNGSRLVFTHCNENYGYGSCDLYESIRVNGQWGTPKNLGPNINGSGWESQPSLNHDGTILYFSSNRPGGQGGSDIWMSQLDSTLSWLTPVNLGATVNTNENERSPFIHADGVTLYYSSDGLKSVGGYDLYFSQSIKGLWTEPQNCGAPINTIFDDQNLIVSTTGTVAYYSRKDSIDGDRNIYQLSLPENLRPLPTTYVKLIVLDRESLEPLIAQVTLTDIGSDKVIGIKKTDRNGSLLSPLPLGKNISVIIDRARYLFHSENLNYSDYKSRFEPFIDTIYLERVPQVFNTTKETPKLVLRNIFFESGSSVLEPESLTEIKNILNLLESYPEITITIIGHTDNIGSDEDNLSLSIDRSNAIKQSLIELGIDENRVKIDGKGESDPIADNTTDEGRALNRRTELLING